MTLSLPPIHLTDLGKNPEGITAADLSRSVLDAIVAATVKAVGNAGDLGKNAEQIDHRQRSKRSGTATSSSGD